MQPPDPATARVARAHAEPGIVPEAASSQGSWVRVAIALVCAGQGMAFGLAANQTPPDTAGAFWVLHGGLAASALLVLVLLGGPLLRECLSALRAGRITVDLLFLLSLLGAFGASVFSTVRRDGPVFYELVAILLAIYTVGKMLGARSRARALEAVQELRAEHATCTRLGPGDQRERVNANAVVIGDRVSVAPGETIAVDGVIEHGRGLVGTTPLTGEPDPALRVAGDAVLAGMRSVDGVLVIRVTAAAGARRLDGILGEIETARLAPSRLQSAADQLAARFVPVVFFASLGTFAFWLWRGPLVPAVENALAVLVVACPCALGLATPLGLWSALVRLGRLGIVARSGDFVEGLACANVALFDKTGTLCEPDLRVRRFDVLPRSPLPERDLRGALCVAEAGVDHPIAAALRTVIAAADASSPRFVLIDARVIAGSGVAARVRDHRDGATHEILAGTPAWIAERNAEDRRTDPAATLATPTTRRVEVAVNGIVAAEIELEEEPRADVDAVFAELQSLGLAVEILTGDPAFGNDRWPEIPRATGLSPEAKSARVRDAQAAGAHVLFVGDGLNDAAALAAADVAIALRHGADLARSNALAVIAGEHLGTLPAAVRLARAVRHAIRANLRFAVFYNSGAMALAAAGLVHPVLAALLMAGSSVIVSTRVLRASAAATGLVPSAENPPGKLSSNS